MWECPTCGFANDDVNIECGRCGVSRLQQAAARTGATQVMPQPGAAPAASTQDQAAAAPGGPVQPGTVQPSSPALQASLSAAVARAAMEQKRPSRFGVVEAVAAGVLV